MDGRYAVLGATGAQGGAVVQALADSGASVRGITRSVGSRRAQHLADSRVEVVAADLSDVDSVASAFDDVDGVFASTTPFEEGPSAELEQGATTIAAAQRASVPHLVFSSVSVADKHTGIPHFDSGPESSRPSRTRTVIHDRRAHLLYDNMLSGLDDVRAGRLGLPIPLAKPLQQLARRPGPVRRHRPRRPVPVPRTARGHRLGRSDSDRDGGNAR